MTDTEIRRVLADKHDTFVLRERRVVMRRLAREFVDELLTGRPHRRATHEEAPPTAARREETR